jgi:hypothetical protein
VVSVKPAHVAHVLEVIPGQATGQATGQGEG